MTALIGDIFLKIGRKILWLFPENLCWWIIQKPIHFLRFSSEKKYYLLKSGQVGMANSLISYGKIPERFKALLPNEGQFITRKLYYRLRDNVGHNCQMKGCYDRYHCYYYHPELTEPDGPWNKIPANCQPGWEGCPLFINKAEIPEI